MGGLAGWMGTIMIGPRIGLYYADKKLSFILDDENFLQQRLIQEEIVANRQKRRE
jgi:hypothetical protein